MTPARGRWRALLRVLAACGVGALLALSGPPLSVHPLAALPAFVVSPLLLLLTRAHTPPRAALLGVCAGVAFGAYSLRFAFDVLERFSGLRGGAAVGVWMLLCLLQAAPLGLALGLARLVDTRPSSRLYLTLPLSLSLSFALVPLLFPWHLGHFTLPWLPWAQQAELGGLPLVDLTTALVGCCALEGMHRRSPRLLMASLALLLVPAAYGYVRCASVDAQRDAAPALRVAVLQPDVTVDATRSGMSPAARLARLAALENDALGDGAQLVLWPEAAYPFAVSRAALDARRPSALQLLRTSASRGDGPTPASAPRVIGAMSTAGPCATWNTLIAVDAEGRPLSHVDKRELFPFAEYIPFWAWSSWLRRRYPCRGERAGQGEAVVSVAGARLGLLNCYEDVHPARARGATRAGAQLLLNASNDAWFGRSVQPDLHRIVARFRAIETRRDLVRAVNTGASGHILATGEEALVLPRHRQGYGVASARLLSLATPSVQLGGWVPWVSLLGLLGLGARRLPLAPGGRARQSHDSQA